MRDWRKYPPRRVAASTRAARRMARRVKLAWEREQLELKRLRRSLVLSESMLEEERAAVRVYRDRIVIGGFWRRLVRVFRPTFGL